jgi:predicted ferric reductase
MSVVVQERVTPSPSAATGPQAAPAPVRAHPQAILGLIVAGALACIALWWTNTPSLSGLGDWLTNAGRITGLLAGYGVVVLVALMARIPPVERGVGADKLARWHSMGGRYVVSLVVVHGLLITWGYAVSAHTSVVRQTKTLLVSYPDVLMASVAGLLLLGVGITSARAARKRMRYETWYYLHFYTYLAVALAFSHQFATGAEFMNDKAARVLWGGMYATVAAAILWYRFVTPVRLFLRHSMQVHSVYRESADTVTVVLSGRHLNELQAESGQFFRWRFLSRGLWWASSPYSLSAAPRDNFVRITVKAVGDHSTALVHVRPGTRALAEGPYGALTATARGRRRRRKVLLIAGGVGITPLRAIFETIPAGRQDVTLLYRASEEGDVLFRQELETLAARRSATVRFLVGRRADLGWDPLSAAALAANISDLPDHEVYVCGPPGMTAGVRAALIAAGVPHPQVHTELFEF